MDLAQQPLEAILQNGLLGAVLVLALLALYWITTRYIRSLEERDARHTEALKDIADAMAANGAACSALRDDLHQEAQLNRERHRETLGEIRALAPR